MQLNRELMMSTIVLSVVTTLVALPCIALSVGFLAMYASGRIIEADERKFDDSISLQR
ncbi:hypothetical protein GCM10011390_09370 [Aureimonas endophytica]|uniref:Uncharacterized protein n=1 Tax=Aureimonas endophytica TaxID=2027858 RepID=A0A916ZFH7_9HYPH|nr:hypothetical protein GCM10011390_09370 [Aureimonas endophytica]